VIRKSTISIPGYNKASSSFKCSFLIIAILSKSFEY
jgi:hypothetical protein